MVTNIHPNLSLTVTLTLPITVILSIAVAVTVAVTTLPLRSPSPLPLPFFVTFTLPIPSPFHPPSSLPSLSRLPLASSFRYLHPSHYRHRPHYPYPHPSPPRTGAIPSRLKRTHPIELLKRVIDVPSRIWRASSYGTMAERKQVFHLPTTAVYGWTQGYGWGDRGVDNNRKI